MKADLAIEAWTPSHPRWPELQALIDQAGQASWMAFSADWHHATQVLVAHSRDHVGGFLRYMIQPIGPDMDCAPLRLGDEELREAKVLAFAVATHLQRRGIGRALQLEAVRRARAAGCYQVRSRSASANAANHHLKLALGFGAHPVKDTRGEGVYFVLPLRAG